MSKDTIYSLKKKLKEKEDELREVRTDRELYRKFLKVEISNQLTCMKDKQYIPAEAMVKKYVSFTSSVQGFSLYLY